MNNTIKKIVGLFYYIIIMISISASILILSNLSYEFAKNSNSNKEVVFSDDNTEVFENITKLNNKLLSIDEMQNDYIRWSVLINEIAEKTDEDIKFTGLTIDKKNELTIILKGTSKSRESVLSLKKYLDESSIFTNIDFPLQNILEKTNINFIIRANILADEISQ